MVNVPFDPVTSLPIFCSFHDVDVATTNLEVTLCSCMTEEANQNISFSSRKMLRCDWRLGHSSMVFVKWLAHRGLLGRHSDKVKVVQDGNHSMCASCNCCGKQVRTPSRATVKQQRPDQTGVLKQEQLEPGDCVAVDQFVVRQGGRLFTTSGREREEDRFKGGTIFVDMATGKMFVKFQVSLGTQETLLAKACFEKDAALHGVKIKKLSHWQWSVHCQRFHCTCARVRSTHHLFRSGSPPSEWDCRESHWHSSQKGTHPAVACTTSMVRTDTHQFVAHVFASCSSVVECLASHGHRSVP